MSTAKNILTAGVAVPVLLPLLPVIALAWAFSAIAANQAPALNA